MLALLAGLILAPGAFACAPASPPVPGSFQLASLLLTGAGKPNAGGGGGGATSKFFFPDGSDLILVAATSS